MHDNKKGVTLATPIIPFCGISTDVLDHVEESSTHANGTATSGSGVLNEVVSVAQSAANMSDAHTVQIQIGSGEGHILTTDVEHDGSVAGNGGVHQNATDGSDAGEGNTRIDIRSSDDQIGV